MGVTEDAVIAEVTAHFKCDAVCRFGTAENIAGSSQGTVAKHVLWELPAMAAHLTSLERDRGAARRRHAEQGSAAPASGFNGDERSE